jgi:DNA-binding response OmpR family regulator
MTGQSILVVDDEPNIREIVALYLTHAGYDVRVAPDGKAALHALTAALPDLVILDVMLPHVDGFEITRRLRQEGSTPIILLTARREEADRIEGLELGADDYVVKPFSPQELVSRVRAVLRRARAGAAGGERREDPPVSQGERTAGVLTFDGLVIDGAARTVLVDGATAMLTAKEFDLLWFLASHPRQVYNREQLLAQVWGETQYIDASTVTVHVRRLREKLEKDAAAPHYIQTVWGVGYRFGG